MYLIYYNNHNQTLYILQINESDIANDVTEPQLDVEHVTHSELDSSVTMSVVSTASPHFVPSSGNDFMQNMSSLSGVFCQVKKQLDFCPDKYLI